MRQGLLIGCPEEIVLRLDYIDNKKFGDILKRYVNSSYDKYLKKYYERVNKYIILIIEFSLNQFNSLCYYVRSLNKEKTLYKLFCT